MDNESTIIICNELDKGIALLTAAKGIIKAKDETIEVLRGTIKMLKGTIDMQDETIKKLRNEQATKGGDRGRGKEGHGRVPGGGE